MIEKLEKEKGRAAENWKYFDKLNEIIEVVNGLQTNLNSTLDVILLNLDRENL